MNDSILHEVIISHFLAHQRPPTVKEIGIRFQCEEVVARNGLRQLADNHGVVLHPQSDEIWIAHPFAAAPTTCVVSTGNRKWWGNCVWCSLGVAHLAGGSANIETRVGAIGDPVTLKVNGGEITDTDFVVHFPIPMRRAWDNVVYTCSVQLLFRNETEVDLWCRERGIQKGDVRPIKQVSEFAKVWYGRHADADWTKWTLRQAAEIFRQHHLDGPVWALTDDGERF